MKDAKLNWVRLPLNNIKNCRDMGGYNTEYGQQTKWHSFLRSSELSSLIREDIDFLLEYGVSTVIDLRRGDEIELYRNPFSEIESVDYFNIPFSTESVVNIMDVSENVDFTMSDYYMKLLKREETIREIFNTIYNAKDGCILFNCQGGKDRTGILAMFILGIAGVERKDIVSNFEVSYTNLEIRDIDNYKNIPARFLLSTSDYIVKPIDYILSEYGSFNGYLLSMGIEQHIIDGVKAKIS